MTAPPLRLADHERARRAMLRFLTIAGENCRVARGASNLVVLAADSLSRSHPSVTTPTLVARLIKQTRAERRRERSGP
jgi:hypothetical protein